MGSPRRSSELKVAAPRPIIATELKIKGSAAPKTRNFYNTQFSEEIKPGENVIYVISIKPNGESPEQSGEKLDAQLSALQKTGCKLTILIADSLQIHNISKPTEEEKKAEALAWGARFLEKNAAIFAKYPHFKIKRWAEFLDEIKEAYERVRPRILDEYNDPTGDLAICMKLTLKESKIGHERRGQAFEKYLEESSIPYQIEEYITMIAMGMDINRDDAPLKKIGYDTMTYVSKTSAMAIVFSEDFLAEFKKPTLNVVTTEACTPRHGLFYERVITNEFSNVRTVNNLLNQISARLSSPQLNEEGRNKLMVHILTFIRQNTRNFQLKTGEYIHASVRKLLNSFTDKSIYSNHPIIALCEEDLAGFLKDIQHAPEGEQRKRELLVGLYNAVDFRINPPKKLCEETPAPTLRRGSK